MRRFLLFVCVVFLSLSLSSCATVMKPFFKEEDSKKVKVYTQKDNVKRVSSQGKKGARKETPSSFNQSQSDGSDIVKTAVFCGDSKALDAYVFEKSGFLIFDKQVLATLFNAARYYISAGEYEKAKKVISVLKRNKSRVSLMNEIAVLDADLLFLQKKYKKARKLYYDYRSTFPGGEYASHAQYHEAVCLQKLGDFKNSKNVFAGILVKYPMSFEALELERDQRQTLESFTVVVGSFFDCKNAERIFKSYKSRGFDSFMLRTLKDNEVYHKVCVGRFKTVKDANDYIKAKRLKGMVFP